LTYVANTGSTISPKALTVSFSDADKTYDGTLEVAIGAETFSGVVAGDAVSLDRSGMGATYAAKKAGTQSVNYTGIALTGTDAGNYTINGTATSTGTIQPKALTFTPSSAVTKTYDGTTAITGTGTTTGVVAGDVVSTSAVGNFADKNAGSGKDIAYAITLSGTDAGNYTINSTAAGTGTINKAALTVTANALNKTYDGTTEGTGGTYSTTGLMGTDTFTGAALAFTDKTAGEGKTLNVSGGAINDGNGGNNYTITYVSNSGSTIAPKAITVSFSDADKTYDGTQAAAIGAETFSGVVAGDAVSLDRSGMGATYAAKNAGTQSVNYTGIALTGTDAGNYTINSTAVGSGIINRKAVTFVVDKKITKDYDGTTTVHGTGTATGFVSGDDAAVNALGNTADSSAGENKPVNYVFSLLGMDADNYFLTSTTGGGTVTISTGKMEEVSTLAAAIVPKETMVGIPEIETIAPQSNTGSGDTVSKDSDNKEEKKQTEEQTDNQVNTQGNEPIRHEFGNDGKLSFTNKGVNPPTSMSAEAVAQQQSQETAGREEDNQSMDSNNN
ncbi:MAG: hypothetical protein J6O13_10665, partial [Selenomonas sp.]|nr:hypothetical protein [Selenomonas sp.]